MAWETPSAASTSFRTTQPFSLHSPMTFCTRASLLPKLVAGRAGGVFSASRLKFRFGRVILKAWSVASIAGCAAAPPEPSPSAADAPPAAAAVFDLGAALELSARQQLDVETVESLRLIAVEHVDNTMLLRLPGIAFTLPAKRISNSSATPRELSSAPC